MDKKRKIEFIAIMVAIVLLTIFLVYTLGKSIYDFVDRTNKSHQVVEKFNEIYQNEGTKIVLFASPKCRWCKKFIPILDEISKENDFKYIYLDVSSLFENDLNKIYEKLELEYEGIPHLIILNDQKVIGEQVGAEEKETTIELLKKVGVIKGEDEDGKSISASS